MVEYIPGGIFRASFKFCMGDKLREKMERVKGMKRFSVHFNLHNVINIWLYNHVFINIILSMPYKYNLSDVFINVLLEGFSERKICC